MMTKYSQTDRLLIFLGVLCLMLAAINITPLREGLDFITSPLRKLTQSAKVPQNTNTDQNIDQLNYENSQLRGLLQQIDAEVNATPQSLETVVASVHFYSLNTFTKEITINVGSNSGIKLGQAVASQGYLVGKVSKVNKQSSVVQLVSDSEFRMIVSTASSQGLLLGKYNSITMDRVPRSQPLLVGDTVSTTNLSGEGIPAGIAVGRVVAVYGENELTKRAQVSSPVGLNRLSVVSVIISEVE